jgi:hypothetical protein
MNSSEAEARMEILESQVRNLHRILILAALVVGALVLVAATPRSAQVSSFNTIRVRNIQVVDSIGRVRIRLNGEQPVLNLSDQNGLARLGLQVLNDGSTGLWISTDPDHTPIMLGCDVAHNYGPHLRLEDQQGYQTLIGVTEFEPATPTGTRSTTSAASITLVGSDGKTFWTTPK